MSDDDKFNLDRLIKMMGMTSSDNDNQALVAIRTANKLLASAGASWDDILRAKVKVIADPFASIPMQDVPKSTNRGPAPAAPPPPRGTPRASSGTAPGRASGWTAQNNPPPPNPTPRKAPTNFTDEPCDRCGFKVLAGTGIYNNRGKLEHDTGDQLCQRQQAQASAQNGRPNKFADTCALCNNNVPAGEGILSTNRNAAGKYTVTHQPGKCPPVKSGKRKVGLSDVF